MGLHVFESENDVDEEQDSKDDADRCMNRYPSMHPGLSASLGIPLMSLLHNRLESVQNRFRIVGAGVSKHSKPIKTFLQRMERGSFRQCWQPFRGADECNIS